MSRHDLDRFGIFPFWASPRHADVLIAAGTVTTKMADPLVRLWEQMIEAKWFVADGDLRNLRRAFQRSYSVVQGIDRLLRWTCTSLGVRRGWRGLIYGLMKLQELIKLRRAASGGPRSIAGQSVTVGRVMCDEH